MDWPLVLRNSGISARTEVNRAGPEKFLVRSPKESLFAERARSNEPSVDDKLLQPYRAGIARIVYLLISDSCDASEVIQETFRNVSCNSNAYRDASSLRICLLRIAVSRIQKRQRWWKRRNLFAVLHRHSANSRGLYTRQEKDVETVIRHGLSRLRRRHRLILVLRDFEGLSYAEISEVLRLPTRTVRSRLTRARRRMITTVLSR